jgi:hypothetical protein
MAVVAQLVEHRIVIPVVVGSIPIHRPNYLSSCSFDKLHCGVILKPVQPASLSAVSFLAVSFESD